jgi:hypothetical protein
VWWSSLTIISLPGFLKMKSNQPSQNNLQDRPESLKAPEKQERSSAFRALDRG